MFLKKHAINNDENKNLVIKLFFITLYLVVIFFLYQIGNIIAILVFALFLNVLFSPFLNRMNKWKIGDWLWIIIIYLVIIIFISIVFFAIVPIFIKQIILLTNNISDWISTVKNIYEAKWVDWLGLPKFIEWFLTNIDFTQILETLKNNMSEISSFIGKNFKNFLTNWAGFFISITQAIVHLVLVFVFSFFIALERKKIRGFFYKIIPENISKHIKSHEEQIVNTLYNWLKGQIILWTSLFIITLCGLLLLRFFWIVIEEYLILALIAWMMEFVPYVGPFIALLPALAISAALWFKASFIVFCLYIAIQQIENNLLVPYVMSKALSLSPFSVLIAMTIGATLFGIIWIIIAIPVVSIIQIFITPFLEKKKEIK